MSARIEILHQKRDTAFDPFDPDVSKLEVAYTYWPDRYIDLGSNDALSQIFRENNAIEGWEENVKAEARSLSVGDVVKIKQDGDETFFAVDPVGFKFLLEADVLIALGRGRNAAHS